MQRIDNLMRLLHRNAKLYAQWPVAWLGIAHSNISAIEHDFIALCFDLSQTIVQQLNKQQ
jgi:hypothetical protein